MRRLALVGGVAAAFLVGGCRGASDRAPAPSPSPTAAALPPTTVAEAPSPSPSATPTAAAPAAPSLTEPTRWADRAPDRFRVKFETTKGPFVIEVVRAWAPKGADRFYNLAKSRFFDDVTFFRVISGFMVQFGIHGKPDVAAAWRDANIQDDPVKESNKRGTITFATAGPNTRTTQIFINFKDNAGLDGQGFSPFGRVVEGMEVVDQLYAGYGEGAPGGAGPSQGRAQSEGNGYFRRDFPKLDYIKKARVEGSGTTAAN